MRNRTAAKPLALLAALLVLGGLLTACGDDGGDDSAKAADTTSTTVRSDDSGTTVPGGEDDGTDEVTIVAKDFSLTSVTAKAGAEVYVDNQGSATHTVTADDGAFDTGEVDAGQQAELTAPSQPGTYAFHCKIHPSMTGTLTVTG
jgi:plastocyanin